jgi:hypothetical protein
MKPYFREIMDQYQLRRDQAEREQKYRLNEVFVGSVIWFQHLFRYFLSRLCLIDAREFYYSNNSFLLI